MVYGAVHATVHLRVQAGLLTLGSSYRLRLPSLSTSGIMQLSSPNTAAGPSPSFTEFPIKLYYEHLNKRIDNRGMVENVKGKIIGVKVC
jgi:hypothetical protein